MNIINDKCSVTDLSFPGTEDCDTVSGNNFHDSSVEDGKIKSNEISGEVYQYDLPQFNKSWTNLYNGEWEQLFRKDFNIDELKKLALDGKLKSNHFRSICWRCMLGILHSEPFQWLMELKTYRSHYNDLWIELQKNPWNVEKSPSDNPLSQEEESIWQKHFSNEKLKFIIHQDVVRTFPGVNFFRRESIQDLMVRILFCYARQNPSLCYRQGMHEILAPVLFVLNCDYQAVLYAKKQNFDNPIIYDILDPKYIEEDAYSIFKHIMNHIECTYRIKNMIPTSTGYFKSQLEDDKNCENEVIARLQYIKDNILQESDPDLNKHLDELDIPLLLFGIRWLRLLFGREFPFQDLLVLWDAIFAVKNFELVNYIVVSMLTAVRSIILAGDYTTCLTKLMHYPSGVDVMFVIKYALHIMNPSLYPSPTVKSFPNKLITLIPKAKAQSGAAESFEGNDNLLEQTERLKITNEKPNKWLSGKTHSLVLGGTGEGDGNIIEGYTLDDPKILKCDLENLSSTLVLVQTKLSQYYETLQNNLTEPVNSEVKVALDGISELCNLLKNYGNYSKYLVVEPASEAGEIRHLNTPNKKNNVRKKRNVDIADIKANTLPKAVKKLPPGELKLFKQCEGGPTIAGAPLTDPLRFMKKISSNSLKDDNKINPQA